MQRLEMLLMHYNVGDLDPHWVACTVCTGQKYLSLPVRTIWKQLWKRNTGDKLFYMICRRRDSINWSHVKDTQVQFTTKYSMHGVCTDLIQGALWIRRWVPLRERSVVLAAWQSPWARCRTQNCSCCLLHRCVSACVNGWMVRWIASP